MMVNVCETLLLNVRTNLLQSKRTNAELKQMLHGMFASNKAELDKLARFYGNDSRTTIFDRMNYEHDRIEQFKKSVYGDDYEVERFP